MRETLASAITHLLAQFLDVGQFPALPRSNQAVSITARIVDELPTGVTAAVHWRIDGASPGAFQIVAMADDGLHGDGAAGELAAGP